MSQIYTWGIHFIQGMQAVGGPFLDGFFKGITFLGDEEFYLLLFPFIFWCLDTKFGAKLVYILLITGAINYGLKDLFAQPRPFVLQPGINLVEATGYGLPSGHAQSAVLIWGALASRIKKTWGWIVAVLAMLLIGVSRIYLGVHFPTDVLAGWALGAVLLSLVARAVPGILRRPGTIPLSLSLVLITGVTAAALGLNPSRDLVSVAAAFWGFSHGLLFLSRFFCLSCSGNWGKRIARYPIGLLVSLALYLGLKALFPEEGEQLYLLFRFIRYALLGLWIGLGAPLVFRLLHLSQSDPV